MHGPNTSGQLKRGSKGSLQSIIRPFTALEPGPAQLGQDQEKVKVRPEDTGGSRRCWAEGGGELTDSTLKKIEHLSNTILIT